MPPPAFTPPEAVAPTTPPTPAAPEAAPPPPPPPAAGASQATRQDAVDKAVADSKLSAVTRSQAKLVPYAELKKGVNRVLLADTLPGEVPIWVVAVSGTVTALAEPAIGHAVAYLAKDQHASLAFDLHTGTAWPAWFDALPDQSTD